VGPTRGILHDPVDSPMILRTATSPQLDTTTPISTAPFQEGYSGHWPPVLAPRIGRVRDPGASGPAA